MIVRSVLHFTSFPPWRSSVAHTVLPRKATGTESHGPYKELVVVFKHSYLHSSNRLDDESKTSHSSSTNVRHSSGHSKAVRSVRSDAGLFVARSSSNGSRSGDRRSARLAVVGAGVSGNGAALGVGRVSVAAREANVGGGFELGVGSGAAGVGCLADSGAVGVHGEGGGAVGHKGGDGDEGAFDEDAGAGFEGGEDDTVDVGGGSGDCGRAAGAIVSVVAVLVAVCGDQGDQAKDEEVGDLHVGV